MTQRTPISFQAGCRFCSSGRSRLLAELPRCRLLQCLDCALTFTDLSPSGLTPEELYPEDYFNREHAEFFARTSRSLQAKRRRCLRELEKVLPLLSSGRELLDVGCGTGTFMEVAAEQGFRVTGVEPLSLPAAEARAKGLTVLDDLPEGEGRFDLITLLDVFEHLPDPGEVLSRCRTLLKSDGVLLLETINEDALMSRTAARFYAWSKGRLLWPMQRMHPIQHLFHPTQAQTLAFLKRNGFDALLVEKNDLPLGLVSGSLMTRAAAGLSFLLAACIRRQWCLRVAARKTPGPGRA